MFRKLLDYLFERIVTSGLNESVWSSSEKEKFESLLDIRQKAISNYKENKKRASKR